MQGKKQQVHAPKFLSYQSSAQQRGMYSRILPLLYLALFFCLVSVESVFAEQTEQQSLQADVSSTLKLEASVSRSEVYLGDRFQYSVNVTYPDSGRVELPGLIGNTGAFEVKEFIGPRVKDLDGLKVQEWVLTLTTFVSGDFVLPPQLVEYFAPGRDAIADSVPDFTLHTEPVPVRVLSRVADSTVDIIDHEAPMDAPNQLMIWPWLVVAGLILAGLGLLLWLRSRNKQQPQLPPWEEAQQKLSAIDPATFWEEGRQREWMFALSEILRRYLHRRFESLDALDATTTELNERAGRSGVLSEQQLEMLRTFNHGSDEIKFASLQKTEEECRELDQLVRTLVQQTRPLEEEAGK